MPVRYLVTLAVPLLIIALAIPLILQKVPRNRLYGFCTPYTMSSDAVWYRANKISGIALAAGGIFWLVAGQVLPRSANSGQAAFRLTSLLGTGAVLSGCVVSFWPTYRK